MNKAVAEELESKHAALHALIEEEEHRSHPDEDLLHRLKKEKLRLKDAIAGHYVHYSHAGARRRALGLSRRATRSQSVRDAPAPQASSSRWAALRVGRARSA